MRELGHLGKQPQLRSPERLEKSDRFAETKFEKVDLDTKPKYTIDEIIDKVEEGDLSVLVELGIIYTEITTATGDKIISFKFEGTKFVVNIINNPDTADEIKQEASNNTQTFKIDDGSSTVLEELKNLEKEYQKQLDDISIQIRSLEVPTPPNAMDYENSSDGSIDENAYNKAMQQYNEQMINYHNRIDELNKKAMEIQNKLQQINKQITELEFEIKFEIIENIINSLKLSSNTNNELISILETTLENIKQGISGFPNKKLELQNKIQDIYSQILSMQVPVPPSAGDFKKADSSVDEEAYKTAFNNYEYEKYQYDVEIVRLEAEVSFLRNEIAKIDMEIQKQTYKLNQLEHNVNAGLTIQNLINKSESSKNNEALISQLKQRLEDLYKNIKTQNEIEQYTENLYNTFNKESIPVPPSTNDFRNADGIVDTDGYNKAYTEYEEAREDYNRKMQQYNMLIQQASDALDNITNQETVIVFNAAVSVIENNIAKLRESGNSQKAKELEIRLNNLKREFNQAQEQRKLLQNRESLLSNRLNLLKAPKPPKTSDFLADDGRIEEDAYQQAINDYEKQKSKYDSIFNNILKQINIIKEKLSILDAEISKIQESIMDLT